jgi:hypothetical protein
MVSDPADDPADQQAAELGERSQDPPGRASARRTRRTVGAGNSAGKGGVSAYPLLIDGKPSGSLQTQLAFNNFISWSGLDVGRDRSSPVSRYEAPFEFTGRLLRVTVAMHDDQKLDGDGIGAAEMARQ